MDKFKKTCRTLLIIVILAVLVIISGCSKQMERNLTLNLSQDENLSASANQHNELPAPEKAPSQMTEQKKPIEKCPDNICDDFEMREGVCREDCKNIEGWKEKQAQSQQAQQMQNNKPQQPQQPVSVKMTGAKYESVASKPSGWFKTGQDAEIMLSGVDFDNTGGPLLFNHPGEIATDGTHFFLADRNNNRVLAWNKIPSGNTAPDMVLGQKDFITNNPGTGNDQMNWPVGVSAANGKLVVADTYNERILIWNSIPTRNAQPADLILQTTDRTNPKIPSIRWPWGVWTDGKKLAVSSTQSSSVLIWNNFPVASSQQPDLVLTAAGKMGTPRGITSNGEYFIVADHNARIDENKLESTSATFVWKKWPDSDTAEDFTLQGWRTGTFLPDNSLMLLSTTHHAPSLWHQPPTSADDEPDLQLEQAIGPGRQSLQTGDGSDIAWADNKLYLSLSNGNRIIAYNSMPKEANQKADFAIGSPGVETNTLETNFFMTNPAVATDGKSLFASSDFDKRMYVWKSLPDESNAHPDLVYDFQEAGAWDNALWRETLVLAGKKTVYLWKKLPLNGEKPDIIFSNTIGNVNFQELRGVALDDKYFYLADTEDIYVWEGIPEQDSNPKFTISNVGPGPLDSDGEYLAGTVNHNRDVGLWNVGKLESSSKPSIVPVGGSPDPGKSISFNLPGSVIVKDNHLFVADTGFGRVLVWTDLQDALNGKPADVVLGEQDLLDVKQEIGRNKLFWPATMAFDGSYLWVGEFKFSGRILRFSVQ